MKIAAIALIIIASVQTCSSQFISNVGAKVGVTFSNQDHRDSSGYLFRENHSSAGLNAGFFIEFLKSKHYNFVLDGGYDQRGYSFGIIETNEFGEKTGEYTVKYNTHYVLLDLLGKLSIPGNKISAYFTAGPRLDLYIGYTREVPREKDSLWYEIPNTILDGFKKVNYGFTIGTGVELSFIKHFTPFIEANYSPKLAASYEDRHIYVKEHYFNIKLGMNIFEKSKKKK